jgi:hypothetical protein
LPNYPKELQQVVMGALSRDRGKRTPSAAHVALALDQFCMRQGLVTGPLIVSHYVRSIFPYERAHEPGMGIASVSSPGTKGLPSSGPPATGGGGLSAEELEQRLLADELRQLERERPAAAGAAAARTTPVVEPVDEDDFETDIEELNADDLLVEEPLPRSPAAASSPLPVARDDRLGLDQFDEDSEVKPVVLLSPKRKVAAEGKTDGAFMSDLERRLREDAD